MSKHTRDVLIGFLIVIILTAIATYFLSDHGKKERVGQLQNNDVFLTVDSVSLLN